MATTKKSSAQSSGKLRSFFSKLNPNSPAKKLLAFVLVFAVLGGGYYAYRSFAATSTIIRNASEMTGGTAKYATVSGKRVTVERTLTSTVYAEFLGRRDGTVNKDYWYLCANVRDIHNSPFSIKISLSSTYKRLSFAKSGWHYTGLKVGPGSNAYTNAWGAEVSGSDIVPDNTVAVRQFALVKNNSSCKF